MSADSTPHSSLQIPQRKIREPLATVFDYAMRGAGNVASRRGEVLDAANTIIERYADLEEQLEAAEAREAKLRNVLRRIADAPWKSASVTGNIARKALADNDLIPGTTTRRDVLDTPVEEKR